jgi:hypothetical protein
MDVDGTTTRDWRKFASDCKIVGEALQPFAIVVACVAIAIACGLALNTYMVSLEGHAREERERQAFEESYRAIELRRPYDEKQLELYVDAARLAARLATIPAKDPDRPALLARFWELYWGQLALVESREFEVEMADVCEVYVSHDDPSRCHAPEGSALKAVVKLGQQGRKDIRARWHELSSLNKARHEEK